MRAKFVTALFTLTCAASAGEYAILTNGFRLHAVSHEVDGETVVLKSDKGAPIELPAATVARFEAEEYTPPPPPAPTAAPAPIRTQALPPTTDPRELLARAAQRAGLPKQFVQSIARAESAFNPKALSPKGAIGLMQLMPATAATLNADPHDPAQNAEAGAMYLRELLVKYQSYPDQVQRAVAAYNAGPGAVDKYNGVPPYRETRNYVTRVIRNYQKAQ